LSQEWRGEFQLNDAPQSRNQRIGHAKRKALSLDVPRVFDRDRMLRIGEARRSSRECVTMPFTS